jgi:hypothetical protein
MPTGLRAEPPSSVPQPTTAEAAQAEARRLTGRQRLLPDLMREAAGEGRLEAVTCLRLEWDELPARLWAAEYTAVHAALNQPPPRPGQAHPYRHELMERARELAMAIRPGLARPTMTPGVR